MRLSTVALVAAGVALGVSPAAHARPSWVSFSPEQTSVTSGVGLNDFVFSTMRGTTRMGPGWDTRVAFGTRSLFAFEAGYMGQYNTLSEDRGGTFTATVAPYMLQTSFDGALRVNVYPGRVEPYLFGGVGYNHVDIKNRLDDPTVGLRFRPSDDELLVPAGGGLSAYFKHRVTLDARFTYRAIFFANLLSDGSEPRLDAYSAEARLGYTF